MSIKSMMQILLELDIADFRLHCSLDNNLGGGGWRAGQILIIHVEDNCGEDPGREVDDGHHCNKERVNAGPLRPIWEMFHLH